MVFQALGEGSRVAPAIGLFDRLDQQDLAQCAFLHDGSLNLQVDSRSLSDRFLVHTPRGYRQ